MASLILFLPVLLKAINGAPSNHRSEHQAEGEECQNEHLQEENPKHRCGVARIANAW